MSKGAGIITFKDVHFEYSPVKPILKEASFVVRRGSKLALMGQNGAGKSTIFSLICGVNEPASGSINIEPRTTIAISRQVIPKDELTLTIRAFFERRFPQKVYDIDPRIDEVLEIVQFPLPKKDAGDFKERVVSSFSGGQQARLLLASALITKPDILLLDEPTNNLDHGGILHLTEFLQGYNKTVIVISHDAEFLNSFTTGVLYLDVYTHVVEQYDGNYNDVLKEITARIERENRKNALLAKEIQENKEKVNYFASKGGKMRLVAKRLREEIEEYEDTKVEVRKEDRSIRPFTIPTQVELPVEIMHLSSFTRIVHHEAKEVSCDLSLKRGTHLQLKGPNGIGKTSLLQRLATGHAQGEHVAPGVKIGYYRQDFSTLDFNQTVYDALASVMEKKIDQDLRAVAAGFLLYSDILKMKIGSLSEGQKGLVAFAQLTLLKPGLLILDEPTNHINFRHIPVIAKALHDYEGAMILVSHVPEFVEQIRIDEVLDLNKGA